MSRPLTDYFNTVTKRKRMPNVEKGKLSLRKAQTQKISRDNLEHVNVTSINLVSDDDESSKELDLNSIYDTELNRSQENNNEASNCSESTIIYTPGTPRKIETPLSVSYKSSTSRDKFYSPVKKRNVKIKSPMKVKKNLYQMMDTKDPMFKEACIGMDDKTVFLLTIINKCLNNNSLLQLLLAKSQNLLSKCLSTKKPGMRLICRLYWRKEGWYTLSQVKMISCGKNDFFDDPTIYEMINDLIENGLIESANCPGSKYEIGFENCLALLKKDDLTMICKEFKLKGTSKQEAMQSLRSFSRRMSNISKYLIGCKSDNASRVTKRLTEKTGPCYRLTEDISQTLKELYVLMYLGINREILQERKLELMLINDKTKRECYPIDENIQTDNASVVFKSRDEFEKYMEASNIYDVFLAATKSEDKCSLIEDVYKKYMSINEPTMLSYRSWLPWLQRFSQPYLYVKILDNGVQELKKSKSDEHIALALDILTQLISQGMFRQHCKAEWYAEKALILDKYMSSTDEAVQVLLEGLESDMSELAKDCMRPRARKIAARRSDASGVRRARLLRLQVIANRRLVLENTLSAHHVYKVPMDLNRSRGKIKFETRTADGLVVQDAEEFCIRHYISTGQYTHGEHWEGRIVTTIFFLLFWDIIYANLDGVRGIFLTHYQKFPLDLFLDSFYVNRRELIKARLKKIEESTVEDVLGMMRDTWNSRPEGELSGIHRDIGWEAVRGACACIGPRALAVIARRAATRPGPAGGGFPDLTLWNEHTGEIKFVEVKTDSDKPSIKQLQWMHYLQEHGIPTEFCYVGVNTKRCKARNS